jgi:predicted metal-binding protein
MRTEIFSSQFSIVRKKGRGLVYNTSGVLAAHSGIHKYREGNLMVRKIEMGVTDETIQQDLARYEQLAVELGATDVAIICAHQVVIDERVRAKCMYPKCPYYGTNAHCPPHAMSLDESRTLVSRFHYALMFRVKVPGEALKVDRDPEETQQLIRSLKSRDEIVNRIESEAFYDGHYLAVGFGGGSCKPTFCRDQACQALQPGQGCRAPYRARPSMEAMGMDVFRMAASQGWEIYPVGRSRCASAVGSCVGLIMIC